MLKDKGAAAFKAQQWCEAIKWYSQAIEVDTECRAVLAVLLGNRGLAKLKVLTTRSRLTCRARRARALKLVLDSAS